MTPDEPGRAEETGTMSARQYEFRDGHFVDTWNEGYDDTQPPHGLSDETWPEMLLETLCGCGSPDVIVEAMGDYLVRVESGLNFGHEPQVRYDGPEFLADLLLAYMACDLGLTEHGGGVGSSWLRDEGKRWLELWRAVPEPSR